MAPKSTAHGVETWYTKMKTLDCQRCHNVIRHGRARGLVIAFCHCLKRETRQRLMDILKKVDEAIEVPKDEISQSA